MAVKNTNSKKKPGPGVGLFLFILLLGGAAAGLHFTGRLQPLIDSLSKKMEKPALPVETVTVPESQATSEPPVEPLEPVKEMIEAPPAPAQKVIEEDAIASAYRKRFNAPQIDQPITIVLKGNVTQTGVLKQLDEQSLRINTGKIEMTVARSQLASAGLARCYEDEYVKYMSALHRQKEAAEQRTQQQNKKLSDAYAQFMSSRGKKVETANSSTTAKQSIDDVDFKKWMEENGQSDLLKARMERIEAYETERKKAGRSY